MTKKYRIGIEIDEIRYKEYELEAESEMEAIEKARDQGVGIVNDTMIREVKLIRKREEVK